MRIAMSLRNFRIIDKDYKLLIFGFHLENNSSDESSLCSSNEQLYCIFSYFNAYTNILNKLIKLSFMKIFSLESLIIPLLELTLEFSRNLNEKIISYLKKNHARCYIVKKDLPCTLGSVYFFNDRKQK
ncbi:hypothetical protein BpHYR1_051856 [Brachionus plicatilis]|uniref:Uncharacterized protein n=1 Tax=Brachionus plicatilis TaxID=10195 RepID=A0A3M7SI55_BRAPC|nr:hypothetical protein BpHYR1_051856 [Brachionus plicatilis]